MLTEVQTRKWTRLFNVYDTNGNGTIERDDLEQNFNNVAAAGNVTPGTPEYEAMHARFVENWEKMQKETDLNKDGKTELKEWLEYIDRQLQKPSNYQVILAMVGRMFDLFDLNGNGVISMEEYKTFYRCWRMPEELAEEVFPKLDLNGDGVISKDEFLELVGQFHLSDDPDAPGNLLFGSY